MAEKDGKKTKLEKDYEGYFRHLAELPDRTEHISLRQPPRGKIVPSVATGGAWEKPIKTT